MSDSCPGSFPVRVWVSVWVRVRIVFVSCLVRVWGRVESVSGVWGGVNGASATAGGGRTGSGVGGRVNDL